MNYLSMHIIVFKFTYPHVYTVVNICGLEQVGQVDWIGQVDWKL